MATPRVLGTATVDGVKTFVVTFVRPDVPAWFRIWVGDSDRLVHREEMRAEGNILDHICADLNGPISITPPGP